MVDAGGEQNGTSESLTVRDATEFYLKGMLSESEDTQTRETPPTQESHESEPDTDAEAASEQAESDEGESADNENASEEGAEASAEQPPLFTVKVDGKEESVTLDELLKGYSRTADYTRKTQSVAELKKQAEAEQIAVRAEREKYAAGLAQLSAAIKQATPQEPNWSELQQTLPPGEFAAQWASWSRHKEQLAAIEAEQTRAEQAVMEDRKKQYQSQLEEARARLPEVIPEWKDPERAKADKAEMVAYAKDRGYTVEELSQVTDPRILAILRKAMLYDKQQQAKPVVRETIEKVKAATPGPQVTKKPVSAATRARQRLAKTGRVQDAAEVFLTMSQSKK